MNKILTFTHSFINNSNSPLELKTIFKPDKNRFQRNIRKNEPPTRYNQLTLSYFFRTVFFRTFLKCNFNSPLSFFKIKLTEEVNENFLKFIKIFSKSFNFNAKKIRKKCKISMRWKASFYRFTNNAKQGLDIFFKYSDERLQRTYLYEFLKIYFN